jgi:hypothetical protein
MADCGGAGGRATVWIFCTGGFSNCLAPDAGRAQWVARYNVQCKKNIVVQSPLPLETLFFDVRATISRYNGMGAKTLKKGF